MEEGYELKCEQAEARLKTQNLPYTAIEFFNAREDDPQQLADFLVKQVERIRQKQCNRLNEVVTGAIELVENADEEQAQEVNRQVARRIGLWLKDNRAIGQLEGRVEESLTSAIAGAHPSSVNASVRREGNWHHPDYAHQLRHGSRVVVARCLFPKRDDFEGTAKGIFRDDELEPAFGLVLQARRILEDGINSLLAKSESLGERIYIHDLKPNAELWAKCREQWGRGRVDGLNYRDRIAECHEDWFSNRKEFQDTVQELVEREWKQILGRLTSILDTGVYDDVAA
ncbi:MAG: hypothetical protein OXC95_04025 [Dehalococcoidia bacterium]|nr:hypothetical protein [Dehalococcoidia bacterium]